MNKQFPRRTKRRILAIDVGGTHIKVLVTSPEGTDQDLVGPDLERESDGATN
jgi:hexokinase